LKRAEPSNLSPQRIDVGIHVSINSIFEERKTYHLAEMGLIEKRMVPSRLTSLHARRLLTARKRQNSDENFHGDHWGGMLGRSNHLNKE
jgi:hypothetical protein